MKVSLIQNNPGNDKAANLVAVRRLVDEAVRLDRPDLVVLPEVFDWMGAGSEKSTSIEDPSGGPSYSLCQSLARQHRIWLHAGSFRERIAGDERFYNTTVVFDREGREVARYRKIHMFDITGPDGHDYRESAQCKPGEDIVLYNCEGVTVGCAICYDIRFPELFQVLARRGAKIIILPAAFTLQTGQDHWEVLCRARAIETETFFLAAGQTGSYQQGKERRSLYGNSLVCDPWGHVIAKASNGVGFVSARLDLDRVDQVRTQIPVARHKVIGVTMPA